MKNFIILEISKFELVICVVFVIVVFGIGLYVFIVWKVIYFKCFISIEKYL